MSFESYSARYFETQYKLLSIVGIGWEPVTTLDRVKRVVCSILLLSSILIAVMNLHDVRSDLHKFLMLLPAFLFGDIFLIKYWSCCINHDNVHKLLTLVRRDCNNLRGEEECQILTKRYESGRFMGLIFLASLYAACAMTSVTLMSPVILDIVLPLNESRPKEIPSDISYYVDVEKYFTLIAIHFNAVLFVGCTATVPSEWLNIMFSMHTSAMFQIVSCQVKRTLELIVVTDRKHQEESIRTINRLLGTTVVIHANAYEFFELFEATVGGFYSMLLAVGTVALSSNLILFTDNLLVHTDIEELLCALSGLITEVGHYFVTTYVSQQMIDSSQDVHFDTYDTHWYIAPPSTRRMLMMMMRRAEKGCCFVLVCVHTASVEGFSTVMQMCISYFTILYSIQS